MGWIKAVIVSCIAVVCVALVVVYNTDVSLERTYTATNTAYEASVNALVQKVVSGGYIAEKQADVVRDIVVEQAKASQPFSSAKLAAAFTQAKVDVPQDQLVELTRVMSAGNDLVVRKSEELAAINQEFDTYVSSFPQNVILGILGLPHIQPGDLKPFVDQSIIDARESGVLAPVNPFKG